MRVALIDTGAGNLHSVAKALAAAGVAAERTRDPARAERAAALVLPGQGHFGQVMRAFRASGFEGVVRAHLAAGRPLLGICVGLQLLMESSEEAPDVAGLGLLRGRVVRFPPGSVSVPHMGWNALHPFGASPLLDGIRAGDHAYFAHSFLVAFDGAASAGRDAGVGAPTSARADHASIQGGAWTVHGAARFLSAVSFGHVHATQFHPEKSQRVGLRVLANFARIVAQAAPGRGAAA